MEGAIVATERNIKIGLPGPAGSWERVAITVDFGIPQGLADLESNLREKHGTHNVSVSFGGSGTLIYATVPTWEVARDDILNWLVDQALARKEVNKVLIEEQTVVTVPSVRRRQPQPQVVVPFPVGPMTMPDDGQEE